MTKEYFSTKKLNDHLTLIESATGEDLYLLEGKEKAALIDTSEGMSPLKPLIDKLTDKPYFVIITHGHIDHAMGASEFSKAGIPVYMNLSDRVVYDSMSDPQQRREYAKSSIHEPDSLDNYEVVEAPSVHADDNFNEMSDGQIFDLGDLHIKALHFPGHTPGMTALLFVEDRILLTGDGANRSTFMFDQYAPSIHSYKASLQRLAKETKGQYDHVFISHGVHEVSPNLLNNMIELCDDIIAGNTDDVPFEFMGNKSLIAKKMDLNKPTLPRQDGGDGNIFYNPENI